MNNENAKDLLPDDILRQVQNYAAGKLLYVPIKEEGKSWGEVSGYRQKLMKRNRMICNKYANGMAEEWIKSYFMFYMGYEEENKYFKADFISFGVAKIPLRLIQPEYEMVNSKVLKKVHGYNVKETEPLIVRYEKNRFFADIQNEMLNALKNRKVNAYPAFILTSSIEEYKTFMKNYGKHFIMVDRL